MGSTTNVVENMVTRMFGNASLNFSTIYPLLQLFKINFSAYTADYHPLFKPLITFGL